MVVSIRTILPSLVTTGSIFGHWMVWTSRHELYLYQADGRRTHSWHHLLCMRWSTVETYYHCRSPLEVLWPSLPITIITSCCHHSPVLGDWATSADIRHSPELWNRNSIGFMDLESPGLIAQHSYYSKIYTYLQLYQ